MIGTPGRTLDHIRRGSLVLKDLKVFVLDEADEMLDRGFAHDVEAILAATPRERQTALFSATMPDWVAKTAHRHLRNPQTVAVDADVQTPPEIEHIAYEMDKTQKLDALRALLDRKEGPILVFGRTKHGVKKLAKQLADLGYPVDALQGNLSQNARERVMEWFRSGNVPILVATNVAARGLDIQGIDQVINFDLPTPSSSSPTARGARAEWDDTEKQSPSSLRTIRRNGGRSSGRWDASSHVKPGPKARIHPSLPM